MESTETSRRQDICGCYDAIKSTNNGKCVDNNLIKITKFITPPEPPQATITVTRSGDLTVDRDSIEEEEEVELKNNILDRKLKKFKDISLSSNSDTTEDTSEMNEEGDIDAGEDDAQKQETNNCSSNSSSSRKNSDETVPIIVIPDQCKPNLLCDLSANNPSPSSVRLINNKPSSTNNNITTNKNSFSNRFLEQHIKILPKTQSLDLVDENSDGLEASGGRSSSAHQPEEYRNRMLPKLQTLDHSRPIYPNVPYSPYNSPYGSPRSGRRRVPLRESRRVSIEKSGSFVQLNQYRLMDQIGQGSYGLVKLAYSEEDSTHYAMKILSKRKLLRKAGLMGRGPKRGISPLDRVYREIAVLKKLDHPNVVKLIEVLDDPLEDSLYLVFELLQRGEIVNIPTETPLSEDAAWNVFRDVVLGVEYLHYQRIIHGDLKPANLLLSESGNVKVADLGVCNEFMGEDASMNSGATSGTPAFRSPETLQTGQHSYSGKPTDIWALGITLYAIVIGNVPFVAPSVLAVYEKIKNDELKFPEKPLISEDLCDLIKNLLCKDPGKRLTLPQIKEHQWVTKNGVYVLPSEEENCRLVQISEEDMNMAVTSIPKLETLILIKTMLKKHSFQNPFLNKVIGNKAAKLGSKSERFRAGRSNSAPGDYHSERQLSNESLLPSVKEGTTVTESCSSALISSQDNYIEEEPQEK